MKRFHVHVAVNDLQQSTRFYSALFGMPPTVEKDDYAKWMLDDSRVNFAISERASAEGLNHLGFQAETDTELKDIHTCLLQAETEIVSEVEANCCYAKSDKHWVKDPSGIAWESFRSLDTIPFYGEKSHKGEAGAAAGGSAAAAGSGCGTTCCPATLDAPTSVAGKPAKTDATGVASACCHA